MTVKELLAANPDADLSSFEAVPSADWIRIVDAMYQCADATSTEVADSAEEMREKEWRAYCNSLYCNSFG